MVRCRRNPLVCLILNRGIISAIMSMLIAGRSRLRIVTYGIMPTLRFRKRRSNEILTSDTKNSSACCGEGVSVYYACSLYPYACVGETSVTIGESGSGKSIPSEVTGSPSVLAESECP